MQDLCGLRDQVCEAIRKYTRLIQECPDSKESQTCQQRGAFSYLLLDSRLSLESFPSAHAWEEPWLDAQAKIEQGATQTQTVVQC